MSDPAVEARRLESDAGIAVVLFNWTGAPLAKCTATIRGAARFPRISSGRHGRLSGPAVDKTSRSVTLPLDDVDVLLLEP